MKDVIDKLKKNEYAYMFLSKDEQTVLYEANTKGKVLRLDMYGKWICGKCHTLYSNDIYRIRPDYQPEPEYEDVEIKSHDNYNLHIHILGSNPIYLHEIPSMPNFRGFFKENGNKIRAENIAENLGKTKIVAKLLKELKNG